MAYGQTRFRIVVTSGTPPAMMILSTPLEEGDQVMIPDPGYACYPNLIRFAGGSPVAAMAANHRYPRAQPSTAAETQGPTIYRHQPQPDRAA